MLPDRNTFSEQSGTYARARPRYPGELYRWLIGHCASRERAWDCAAGNGQAAVGLAPCFEQVDASDISAEQIANAHSHPKISYSVRRAEASDFAPASFDLVVVAQALHWLDFPRFWREVSRVARPGALFCAWGYDWLSSIPDVDAELVRPFRDILEPFWAPENRVLWRGYQDDDIAFPFARIPSPEFAIEEWWTLDELIDYMTTWSAYKLGRSNATAVAALDSAERRVRAVVAPDILMPIRMPLKLVASRITHLPDHSR